MDNAQADAEFISRLIKERITPLPQFVLSAINENGKNLLILTVTSGRSTPYYYKADGVTEAYVRVGNETIVAPDYLLNELILKGTNQSYDSLRSDAKKVDYSFNQLEATYRERTGVTLEGKVHMILLRITLKFVLKRKMSIELISRTIPCALLQKLWLTR